MTLFYVLATWLVINILIVIVLAVRMQHKDPFLNTQQEATQ